MLPGITPALFSSGVSPGNDAYTVLLMHFENLYDSSLRAHGVPPGIGGSPPAAVSSAQSKFGGSSLSLNGTNQNLQYASHADWEFGAGDFTVDWWEYRTAAGCVIARDYPTVYSPFLFGYNTGAGNLVYMTSNGSAWDIASGRSMGPNTGFAWAHYAVVRKGSTFYTFQGGIQRDTWTSSLALLANANPLCIGGAQNNSFMTGYIDELRISKGIARWTANFIPPTQAYGPGLVTRALLHFDGGEGGLTMIDSALGLIWTARGTAKKTTTSPKFGSASLFCDTAGWVDTPASGYLDLGASDFTIDCWFKAAGGFGTSRYIAGQCPAAAAPLAWALNCTTANVFRFIASTSGGANDVTVLGTTAITDSNWHHIAVTRSGSTFRLFLDGVQDGGNQTLAGALFASPDNLTICRRGDQAGQVWNGQIDEFRLSVGQALWTANFTPPTLPAGTDADKYATKLLLHMDGANGSTTFGDSSASARGNAAVTNAQVSTAQSKFGGASGLFNGAAYLTYPDHVDFDFGSGDFTVDFFVRMAAVGTQYGFFGKTNASITNGYYLYVNTSGTLQFAWLPSDGPLVSYQSAPLLLDTNWHHIAMVRSGTMINAYFDGVLAMQGPINAGASIVANTNVLTIGRLGDFGLYLNGNIDEFRLTKGIARWTANFSPPTAPYS